MHSETKLTDEQVALMKRYARCDPPEEPEARA